ncbi:neutral and basic amino acid transport protein rBAT-like [Branchiostoma floridae]|uniref:Neutral and basic amino acid transport protein rBAT-like n=1 Tax=Branchiostoma floridae TaxID=7739 RepID=A0A9J7LX13_BRAFL|nr:neutral and basic amino acid transport protein rBAT-like [Branchiostoma floridae]
MSANDLDKAEQGAAEKLNKPENGSPEDGKAADGGLEADEVEPKLAPFAGMGKEELLKVSSEPFWVYLRWTLLVLFWLAWIAMLVGAIVIIVTAPRCAPRPELEWWEHGGFLRVFTRSFKDSDGNGVGDLKGIEEKADYLTDLNVKSLQISAVYSASNFTDVDPAFGTMADFDSLVSTLHDKGLKLVVDFDPNHSGVDHPWFVQSAASKAADNTYKDYYVWADGVGGNPPNNWLSVSGGSAWNYSAARDQWYLHTFQPEQPDLNYRNPDVRAAVKDALRFWAMKGADGFRLTSAKYLVEDSALTDEPANPNYSGDPGKFCVPQYDSLSHPYTTNLDETHTLLQEFRTTLDEFAKDGDSYRLLLTDVMDANVRQVVKYYSSNGTREADIALNYNLLAMQGGGDKPGNKTFGRIQSWLDNLPDGKRANWVIGSESSPRVGGGLYARAANLLLLLLPGTPMAYYGDEIGMADVNGVSTSPMQWNNTDNAGFTNPGVTPWTPLPQNYSTVNVGTQKQDGSSFLSMFQKAAGLRDEPAFQWGAFSNALTTDDVLSFKREHAGATSYLVAINLGGAASSQDYTAAGFPEEGTMALSSGMDRNDEKLKLNAVTLQPGEAIVVSY